MTDSMSEPVRVLYAGTPATALPPLNTLVSRADIHVVAVLTREDAAVGRKKVITPSPVAQRAEELGLPVLKANRADAALAERIRATGAQVAAVVAYGALLPPVALEALDNGWVNLHFSLLPQWRGAAPVQRSLMAGDTVVGATTFVLDEGMDTGAVIGTLTDPVREDDTAGTVLERLAQSGADLLADSVVALARGLADPQPQRGEPSLAPKITSAQARIDWTLPAVPISHHVRGVTPEPGAWSTLDTQRIKFGRVRPVPEVTDLAPGRITLRDGRVLVGTGSCAVALTSVQPAGKKAMAAEQWARGRHTIEDVSFE